MWRRTLIFLLLCGCAQKTADDFLAESEEKCSELVAILEKAESLDDLLKVEDDLKKKFNEIAAIMVKARSFYERNQIGEEAIKPVPSSGPLLDELRRIYAIKGGRELIERAQADASLW